MPTRLSPEALLRAYAQGIFPMAASAESRQFDWYRPRFRHVFPLDHFHVPRRLLRTVRQERFEVTADHAFAEVIEGCAEPAPGRERTWINPVIAEGFREAHAMGFAHSVECWSEGRLVGGIYGLRLGAAFFGESMFSRRRDASKVALVNLVALLRACGFRLFDAQLPNDHLAQFRGVTIPDASFQRLLEATVRTAADWRPDRLSEARRQLVREAGRATARDAAAGSAA